VLREAEFVEQLTFVTQRALELLAGEFVEALRNPTSRKSGEKWGIPC
jgi:hypothetical protein